MDINSAAFETDFTGLDLEGVDTEGRDFLIAMLIMHSKQPGSKNGSFHNEIRIMRVFPFLNKKILFDANFSPIFTNFPHFFRMFSSYSAPSI